VGDDADAADALVLMKAWASNTKRYRLRWCENQQEGRHRYTSAWQLDSRQRRSLPALESEKTETGNLPPFRR
jgi:hypothetical protein